MNDKLQYTLLHVCIVACLSMSMIWTHAPIHQQVHEEEEDEEEPPTSFILSVISTRRRKWRNMNAGKQSSKRNVHKNERERENEGENSFDSRSCVFRVLPYHMIIWYGGRRMDKHTRAHWSTATGLRWWWCSFLAQRKMGKELKGRDNGR